MVVSRSLLPASNLLKLPYLTFLVAAGLVLDLQLILTWDEMNLPLAFSFVW